VTDSKVVVIGASGFIGQSLCLSFEASGLEVERYSRSVANGDCYLDLEDPRSFSKLCRVKDQVVVFLAAKTNLAKCQQYPEMAQKVNVKNTKLLIDILQKQNNFIVFASTNLVFGSKEANFPLDACYAPEDTYSQGKVQIEEYLSSNLPSRSAIVRLSKVLSKETPLIKNWIEQLKTKQTLTPFSDHYLAPVWLADVVELFKTIALQRCAGVFHLSGAEDVSYASFVEVLADLMEASNPRIEPVSAYGRIASPVRYASLMNVWPEDFKANVDMKSVIEHILAE